VCPSGVCTLTRSPRSYPSVVVFDSAVVAVTTWPAPFVVNVVAWLSASVVDWIRPWLSYAIVVV
jgi:hypothetical protein